MNNFELRCCSFCLKPYNLEIYVPVILAQCGHTICRVCSNDIMRTPCPRCPIDKKEYLSLPNGDYIPPEINDFAYHNLLQFPQYNECQIHQEALKYYCWTDMKVVCSDCFLIGDHEGHDITQIQNFKTQVDKKRRILEDCQYNWDRYHKNVSNLLEKRKFEQLEMIENFYQEQLKIVKKQKQETKFITKASYEEEQKRIESLVGDGSTLMHSIDQEISSYNVDNLSLREIATRKGQDIYSDQDQNRYATSIPDFAKDLSLVQSNFEENLKNTLSAFPIFQMPNLSFIQEIGPAQTNNPYASLNLSFSEEKKYTVQGYFTATIQDDRLDITITQTPNQEVVIDVDLLAKVKVVNINIVSVWMSDNDLIPLEFIFNRLTQMHSITVHCKGLKKGSTALTKPMEERVKNLFSAFFTQKKTLRCINLQWLSRNGCDDVLLFLSEEVLSKNPPLENLSIRFEKEGVAYNTFEKFMKNLQFVQEELIHFEVITALNYSEGTELKQYFKMPKLKKFIFRVYCKNCQKAVHGISNKIWTDSFLTMKSLELLDFGFLIVDLNIDESLCRIFQGIKSIKTLKELRAAVFYQEQAGEERQDGFNKIIKIVSKPLLEMHQMQSLYMSANFGPVHEFPSPDRMRECLQNL